MVVKVLSVVALTTFLLDPVRSCKVKIVILWRWVVWAGLITKIGHPFDSGEVMNKSEMIEALAASQGLSKVQAGSLVAAIFDGEKGLIATTIKGGGEVSLQGFGTFKATERKARTALNPKTGAKIAVPAKKAPKFSPGKTLKETLSA
jgi:DNA-binding protein HU-beta